MDLKRGLDLTFTLPAFVVLSPLMALISILIRIRMGPPVFFVQVRPGWGGRSFRVYKFRTMTNGRASNGDLLPDAARLTGLGRLLRSTSLDELPELWNVLRGDMSLVGPRPLLTHYLERYTARQARRHEVKPGLTGWAQVNGRNALSWEEKFELDVWYVDNRSLLLDMKIIIMTLKQVIRREGISHPGAATMTEFNP